MDEVDIHNSQDASLMDLIFNSNLPFFEIITEGQFHSASVVPIFTATNFAIRYNSEKMEDPKAFPFNMNCFLTVSY